MCEEVAEEVVQFFGNGSDSTLALDVEAKLALAVKSDGV